MDIRPCIYLIRQRSTGRVYVGSTVRRRSRWANHQRTLRLGTHHNRRLQRAWVKEGEQGFEFVVFMHGVPAQGLIAAENHAMALFRRHGLFNVCPAGGTTLGLKLGPHSPEHRAKIGAANKGKTASVFALVRSSQVHRGKTLTEAQKAAVGRAARERVHSDTTRAKLSRAAASQSVASRKKRSDSMKALMTPQRIEQMKSHGRDISDETREKRSDSLRRYWATRRALSHKGALLLWNVV